ncbi:MAG: hypothetical protein C0501_03895 [Isosphaera sp.]|nr:hypothetical protein [Isosphaera sp.]
MRRFVLVLGVAAAWGLAAPAQEAVTIKPTRPKAGDRVKVTIEEKGTGKSTVTVAGNTQAKDEVGSKLFVYVDEVIEPAKEGKLPVKLKRTYEKARVDKGGNVTTLPVEGKTVLIEKAGDKYAFTVDGKPVGGDAEKMLASEFDRAGRKDAEAAFLPPGPIKPGETWKIDGAALQEAMGPTAPALDPAKVKAVGKLVKAYQKGGRQFGVIEVTVDAPVVGLGGKTPVEVKDGRLSVTMTADGVIDGSSPSGTSKTVTKMSIAGAGKGFELKVEAEAVETRTVEPLKN